MKKLLIILCVSATLSACNGGNSYESAKMKTQIDSASYSLGFLISTSFEEQGFSNDLSKELLLSGISDGLKGKDKGKIKYADVNKIWSKFQMKLSEKKRKKEKEEAEKKKKENAKFLEKNKAKSGVFTTKSGLQYEILKKGKGKVAKKGDIVKVHYVGKLLNGNEFDSSVARKKPFEFPVGENRVIKGWDEALQLMPVGSKWKIYIPSKLAYGDRKMGMIPAASILTFEVELLGFTTPKKSKKNGK